MTSVATHARLMILSKADEEPVMITAVVNFKLPPHIKLADAAKLFEGSAPKYEGLAGLVRKYYLFDEGNHIGGGVYCGRAVQRRTPSTPRNGARRSLIATVPSRRSRSFPHRSSSTTPSARSRLRPQSSASRRPIRPVSRETDDLCTAIFRYRNVGKWRRAPALDRCGR